jgi:hypothetical protein
VDQHQSVCIRAVKPFLGSLEGSIIPTMTFSPSGNSGERASCYRVGKPLIDADSRSFLRIRNSASHAFAEADLEACCAGFFYARTYGIVGIVEVDRPTHREFEHRQRRDE